MTEITVGSRIKDNDPRMPGRVLEVSGFYDNYVFAFVKVGRRHLATKIRRDRIHTDGKPRRSGWSLVEPD